MVNTSPNQEWMEPGWKNCGPVAAGNAFNLPVSVVRGGWPSDWSDPTKDTGKWGLPIDTPWHHIQWMQDHGELALFHKTAPEALRFNAVLLVHDPEHPYLGQHWCRLVRRQADHTWLVDWDGNPDGKLKAFTESTLVDMMSIGWPFCAYTPDDNGVLPKLNWWQRIYLWLTKG